MANGKISSYFGIVALLVTLAIAHRDRSIGWETIDPQGCPTNYNGHVALQVGSRSYIFGGLYDYIPDGGTQRNETDYFYDHIFTVSPNGDCDILQPVGGIRPPARAFHAGAMDELSRGRPNSLYFFGGGTYQGGGRNAVMLDDLWRYDIRQNRFTQLIAGNAGPNARFGPAMFIYQRKFLYIWGGTYAEGTTFISLNDMWRLNLDTLLWTKLPDLEVAPEPRFLPHFAVWQTRPGRRDDGVRLIMMNGQSFVRFGENTPISVTFNDVWEYSPKDHTWEQHVITRPLARPVRHSAFAIYEDTFILQAGTTDDSTSGAGFTRNQTLFYSLKDHAWTVIDDVVPNFKTGVFAKRPYGTIYNDVMYVTGGVGEIKELASGPRVQVWNNKIWTLELKKLRRYM